MRLHIHRVKPQIKEELSGISHGLTLDELALDEGGLGITQMTWASYLVPVHLGAGLCPPLWSSQGSLAGNGTLQCFALFPLMLFISMYRISGQSSDRVDCERRRVSSPFPE